jgi:hypothetical protein
MNRSISILPHVIALTASVALVAVSIYQARSAETKLTVPDGYTAQAACSGYAGLARSGAIARWRGAARDIVYVERVHFNEVLELIEHRQMPDAMMVVMRDDRPYTDAEKAFIERAARDGFEWAGAIDASASIPAEERQLDLWMDSCMREVES